MPRGGRRTGTPGKAYPNRSDLQGGKAPVMHAPSHVYGQGTALEASQRAVPMGSPPVAQPGAPQQAPFAGITDTGELPNPPGSVDLLGPTQRPDEPLTHGSPSGPGAGPEALVSPMDQPVVQAASFLRSLGDLAGHQAKALRAALDATLSNQATP